MEIVVPVISGIDLGDKLCRELTGVGIAGLGKKLIKKFYRGVRRGGHALKERIRKQASPKAAMNTMQSLVFPARNIEIGRAPPLRATTYIRDRPMPDSDDSEDAMVPPTPLTITGPVRDERSAVQTVTLLQRLESRLKTRNQKFVDLLTRRCPAMPNPPSRTEIVEQMRKLNLVDNHCHIAVAGAPGTGKSSFINAIRGLKDHELGAAKVGCVETTLEITQYLPAYDQGKVIWYDVPGAGTSRISRENYFKEQGLYVMDAIVIMWSDRLIDTHLAIMESCNLLNIPYYLIRSKCDLYIDDVRAEISESLPRGTNHLNPTYATKLGAELEAFRRSTVASGAAMMKKACRTLDSTSPREPEKSIFLVNKKSLYKMMTEYYLDEYSLDEDRFLMQLSQDLVNDRVNEALSEPGRPSPRPHPFTMHGSRR